MRNPINQPICTRCLMMLVFLLMSLGLSAQVKWGSPASAAAFEEVNVWPMNWSNRGGAYPVLSNPNKATVTYSSSNTDVATIDATSGLISPVAPGSTTITASVVDAPSASYTLTYTDDRGEPGNLGFGFSSTTASATYGDEAATLPSLNMGQLSGAAVTYSSSVQSVATVDNTGSVSIKGAGSTEINASFAGDDNVKPGSASYTLTVNPKEVGLTWGTTAFIYDGSAHVPTATATGLVGNDACTVTVDGAKTDAGSSYIATASALSNANYRLPADNNTTTFSIAKAASSVTTAPTGNTLTYTGSTQALVTAGAASGGTMQYSLDNQTFTESVPTGIKVGSYTVYYKVVGDANHENAEGGQVVVTIAKANATVTFASKTASGKMGEAFTAPKVTTSPADLTLAYASSNTKVATVDGSTGAVTLVAAGETTITASFAGNDNYNAANDSYTLTVAKADAVNSDLSFASATATATYGDETVSSPALANPHQLSLTWSSSKEEVAMVNASGVVTIVGAGETVISAAFAGNDTYTAKTISYTLTVNKFQPTIVFSTMSVTAKIGDEFIPPKVTTNPKDLELVYSSTDETVATVDANTGEVKLLGIGTTKIKAVYTATHNYHYVSSYYDLKVSLLDPIEENKDYTMDEKFFVNPDGSEVDLTGHVVNDIFFTLKNTSSPEGDGYDTEGHSIVINTVTAPSVVDGLLADGVEPGLPEFTEKFTGLTFLVTAGTGEIIVNSQEANGYHLMVQVGNDEPVSIYQTERGDYSIPYERDHPTYVYVYNGGTDVVGGSTRGKKSAINVRVYSVSYKGKGSSAIRQVYSEQLDEDRWYDLNGRRITAPTKKGIYINGNRKVVIR